MYCAAFVRSVLRASSLLFSSDEIVAFMVWSWWERVFCVSAWGLVLVLSLLLLVLVLLVLLGSWDEVVCCGDGGGEGLGLELKLEGCRWEEEEEEEESVERSVVWVWWRGESSRVWRCSWWASVWASCECEVVTGCVDHSWSWWG